MKIQSRDVSASDSLSGWPHVWRPFTKVCRGVFTLNFGCFTPEFGPGQGATTFNDTKIQL